MLLGVSDWSFDIIRQSGWDLWCYVCLFAAAVLGVQLLPGLSRVGRRPTMLQAALAAGGIVATLAILGIPALRRPGVGLVWTFILLATVSTCYYLDLRQTLTPRRIAVLLTLRVAALLLAVPMLFEPVLRLVTRRAPDQPLVVMIDTSASMSVPDRQNGPTRLQAVEQVLLSQGKRIDERFKPIFYTFAGSADRLADVKRLGGVAPDGQATDITQAVATALQQNPADNAALLLISDGIDNASPDLLTAMRASRRPINTLLVGTDQVSPQSLVNLSVDRVETGDDWTVNDAATVTATIRSAALADRIVDVKLAEVDDAGKPVSDVTSARLVLAPTPAGQQVTLGFTPRRVGVHKMAVWVDAIPGERSVVDNRQEFQALAIDTRVRVLYIEGRARPEYRELSRALARDPNIESATLLRIQNDRFAASGAIAGKPVTAIPTAPADWQKFDVIVLGDLDSSFLTAQQQQGIEQAVTAGKGLLMLGGQSSFGPGGYQGTPVERALPVEVGGRSAQQERSDFVPRLTADGASHPAMEGLAEWFGVGDKKGEKPIPTLLGNVVVQGAKPGATVLMTHPARPGPDGRPQVVLAVQRYGQGRSAAFTADTTYRLYLPMRGMGQASPYNRLWGQLVRWLAGVDARGQGKGAGIEALLDKTVYPLGETLRLRVLARDARGDATRYAQVGVSIAPAGAGGGVEKRTPSPDASTPADPSAPGGPNTDPAAGQQALAASDTRQGMYATTVKGLAKGKYVAKVTASKDGQPLGTATLAFEVIAPADEMLNLAADEKRMAAIASETGGYSYAIAQLPDLLDALIRQQGTDPLTVQHTVPLASGPRAVLAVANIYPAWPRRFDLPLQAVLVLILLAAEWSMRRRWQLL